MAAYRLGHSMIRPGYRLNDNDFLLPIFPVPGPRASRWPHRISGDDPAWGIDWGRFIDVDIRSSAATPNRRILQPEAASVRIPDRHFAGGAAFRPSARGCADPPSLPQRNLIRSFELNLPSGQDVARSMFIIPLKDTEIMIGKAVDSPSPAM